MAPRRETDKACDCVLLFRPENAPRRRNAIILENLLISS